MPKPSQIAVAFAFTLETKKSTEFMVKREQITLFGKVLVKPFIVKVTISFAGICVWSMVKLALPSVNELTPYVDNVPLLVLII